MERSRRALEKIPGDYFASYRETGQYKKDGGVSERFDRTKGGIIGMDQPNFALIGKISEKVREKIELVSDIYFNTQ